jgi:Tol biopolymer transport system component
VATQASNDFRLVRARLDDPSQRETIAEQVARFMFGPNDEIVFQSESTGDAEIWKIDSDGARQRQLTSVPGDDGAPTLSVDGSEIFFCSNRSGDLQVWKMKSDGSDQRRLTREVGGIPMFATVDWVYYQHGADRTLWRVAVEGGKEEEICRTKPYRGPYVFSPTGTRAAFVDLRANRPTVVIISIPDGNELASFKLADGKGRFEIAWLPDETGIGYTLADEEGGPNSLWIQPIDGGAPRRTVNLGSEEIGLLSFSPGPDSITFAQGGWKHDLVLLSGFR